MSKSDLVKQRTIERAAIILNQYGYTSSSLDKIAKLTGITKRQADERFKNKEEIAFAAFDRALGSIVAVVMAKVGAANTAIDRLHAFVDTFRGFTSEPIVVGGCPILNAAVESDDTNPRLRQHVQGAVNDINALIVSIVELGIRQGEIDSQIEHDRVSTIIFATIEGAIMMSKLYGDDIYLDRAIDHLHQYIDGLASSGILKIK